ncbi:MAG: undecaprenyl/decaprenyl-phosphate alpha-N-acetylglucosaminyl 1-phosphate transferase [Actinomycetota bacterium]|nr:undecaprenyl/decaprenyl-phosphate alpha-N-acetylglucosaminyl 1-phosphate transferase [Actinomycetota bacterium]
MRLELQLLFGLLIGTAVAYAATPVAMRAAVRLQFLDQPVGYKGHAKPTPYLGGSAVVAAFVFAASLVAGHLERTGPVVGGALVLWVVGTTDDRVNLSPFLRLGIEFLIAGALWAFDLGWDLGFGGGVDLVVTALWIAGVINAFNLFDNMDGAAGTMACVAAGTVAILGAVLGDTWLAVSGGALCGACLGFLPYNLSSPPRIFLGDGGSMPVGFVVASLAMIGASDAVREWQALAMAMLLVGIPLLDTCLVVISRRRRGVSVLSGGRDHLTHRTRRRLKTVRAVAVALGTAQGLLAVLALAAYRGGSVVLVIVVAAYVLAAALAIEVLDAGFSDERADTAEARRPPRISQRAVASALLGLAFGLSPFYEGGYNSSLWAPAGLVLLALLLGVAIGHLPRFSGPAAVALAALGALAAWSMFSSDWSSSPELGMVASNRMVLLAAMLGVLLLVVTDSRSALWALGGAIAGTVLVGVWTLGVMLVGNGVGLFASAGRLNAPLGYVNAQGSMYLLALLPLLSLAEWRRSPRLAGVGAGLGTLCAGLAFLSQSRGVLFAFAAALLVTFVVAPGRLRRAAVLAVVLLPVLVASHWLQNISDQGSIGNLSKWPIEIAALLIIFGSLGSGVLWWQLTRLSAGLNVGAHRHVRIAWGTALGIAATVLAIAVVVNAPRITARAQTQYHAFLDLGSGAASEQATRSRLVSGSGARYDYWRIAYEAWRQKPLIGLGAGGYSVPYFQNRRTSETIRQPHSLPLQVLSELGLVGGLLLAAWLAAIGWGVTRALRGRSEELERHLLLAATGLFVAWFVQTSADWLHLLPGLTGVALVAVAVLVRRRDPPRALLAPVVTRSWRLTPLRRVALLCAGLGVIGGLLSLSRQTLSEHYLTRAQQSLGRGAGADALALADRSLRIDGADVDGYYLRSAALGRLNRPDEARRALADALAREPRNFVTWALLGDLEARQAKPAAARRAYRRASELNPLDPGLAELALRGA